MPKPFDSALDLLVYVPVGLALTAAEELPKLAAKGRSRVEPQIGMARVVGQYAVAQGRKQLEKRWSSAVGSQPEPAAPAPDPDISYEDMAGVNGSTFDGQVDHDGSPAPGELAIPGYDSLSASQVVQRLAALSQAELAAVGAYEQAHRARRTILNRVAQLQGR